MQRMNKLHRSRYINVVVSMMMAFLMLAAMGTTQVHAAQYTTGTIDPAELKAGDVVYRGGSVNGRQTDCGL